MKKEINSKVIIGFGLLAAVISMIPNIWAFFISDIKIHPLGYVFAVYMESLSVEGLLMFLGIYLPGFVFGIFVLIVVAKLVRGFGDAGSMNFLSVSRALLLLLSVVGYALVYLNMPTFFLYAMLPLASLGIGFASLTLLGIGFAPLILCFAVGGAVGGLMLSLGLLVMKAVGKKGLFRITMWGAALGALSGAAFSIFAVPGQDLEPIALERSVMSFACLFLIWQPAMLLVIYNYVKKKKAEELPNEIDVTPPTPAKGDTYSVGDI